MNWHETPPLAHTARYLLADRAARAGPLPDRLAASSSVRILGIAVDGVLAFLRALFLLPARVLGAR
jgi:hypothetical protein